MNKKITLIILAFIITGLFAYLGSWEEKHLPVIALFGLFFTFLVVFYKISSRKLNNAVDGYGLGFIIVIIMAIVAFVIYLIDKRLLHYYIDMTRLKIFYKP